MDTQIRSVLKTLKPIGPGRISIELSAAERSPLGRILHQVYYATDACDLLSNEHRSGFPHNGGQHTFRYSGPKKEFVAWLEIVKEELEQPKYRLNEIERQVLSQFSFISQDILSLR